MLCGKHNPCLHEFFAPAGVPVLDVGGRGAVHLQRGDSE